MSANKSDRAIASGLRDQIELPPHQTRVREYASGPVWLVRWREDGRRMEKRVGPAWMEPDGRGGWRRRRGNPRKGELDERTVWPAAAETIREHLAKIAAEEERRRQAEEDARRAEQGEITVRRVAQEWLWHLEHVEKVKPSTLRNYRLNLREPGEPHKRGTGVAPGRIMGPFGDRPIHEVTPREVSDWLHQLRDGHSWIGEEHPEPLSERNINYHRQILKGIFTYACRPDTYGLEQNPVEPTHRHREPKPKRLEFYEPEEVEALARACEEGRHRTVRTFRGVPVERREEEELARQWEDRRDAAFFRTLFYTGLRLSECLTLRVEDVRFLPDLTGAVVDVHRNLSDGQEVPTKSNRDRFVPMPEPAARAVAKLLTREDFTGPDDYVFPNRYGGRLDASALRRRYKAAADAAGLRRLRLHDLRHSAGSVLARSLPLVEVRDILGHAKLQTTARYLHSKVDDRAVAAVNAAFGALPTPVATPGDDDGRTAAQEGPPVASRR